VKVRIVEDQAEFLALAQPWRDLTARISGTPFQEFGWIAAWMRTVGTTGGRRLRLVTLWDETTLVAVLPVVVRRYNGVQLLEWIGARVTDYCDAIIDPEIDAEMAVQMLWEALDRRGGIDVARFGHVRLDAAVNSRLDELNAWVESHEQSVYLDLTGDSGDEWLKRQSSKLRDNLRRGVKKLDQAGFQFHVWEPSEPYEAAIDTALEQKRAWVAVKGLSSDLDEPQMVDFFREVAVEMAAIGSLHVSAIHSGDQFAACHFGYFHNGCLYYYIPTYDLALSKYSAGTVLRDSLIMWACDQGGRRFDMLLGAEGYKERYAGVSSLDLRTLVMPRSLLGRAAVTYYKRSAARTRTPETEEFQEA
jgi:CelD/BcsL family acetyltransferase involved in cellulose biosynthesis